MDLLNPLNPENLFFEPGSNLYKRPKDEPSTNMPPAPKFPNSLLANGCLVEGNSRKQHFISGE